MSLETLLEAARYVELQELKEQQQRQTVVPIVPQAQPTPSVPTIKVKQGPDSAPLLQQATQQQHIIQNSFDIINPLVIDEGGEQKRKQPPLVFRSGTREVHNKLEKHRRAHLKECFDFLKKQLPAQAEERKTSNLTILHSALRYIQGLKRKERELEHEMERLAREKITAQQRLAVLKKEIAAQCDNVDFGKLLPDQHLVTPSVSELRTQENIVVPVERVAIPPLTKQTHVVTNGLKENITIGQQVQTTALSVVPMTGYPVTQGLVLHKVALTHPGGKGITELSPLTAVSSPLAHFLTVPTQQINGKVLPMVNGQYVVKPVVVMSSPPSLTPRPS